MRELVTAKPIIIVVDDDPSILRALRRLVTGAGFDVRTFDRPSTLLRSDLPKAGACLVVDIDLPEMNGVEIMLALGGFRMQTSGHPNHCAHGRGNSAAGGRRLSSCSA